MSFGTLTIRYADGHQETRPLDRPTLRIGRSADNDLVLNDPEVSSYHAELLCDATGCQILDLGSTNGTDVNGSEIAPQTPLTLADRSTIALGAVELVLTLPRRNGDDGLLADLLSVPMAGGTRVRMRRPEPATTGATTLVAEPAVAQAPAAPRPAQLALTVVPPELTADVNTTVATTITIVNRSNVIDEIELTVEGLPEGVVATVIPPRHNLETLDKPQAARGESRIEITPPRAPSSRAGLHRLTVVARSAARPEERVAVPLVLQINPYSEFQFDLLDPKEQVAWFRGRYALQVLNRGNRPEAYRFQGRNDENAFRFRTRPEPLAVEPGQSGRAQLAARLGLLRWMGKPKTYPFSVTALPADETVPPQQANAKLVQQPPLPPWLLWLLLILLLLTLLSCVGWLLFPFLRGWLFPAVVAKTEPTAMVTAVATASPLAGTGGGVPPVVPPETAAEEAGEEPTAAPTLAPTLEPTPNVAATAQSLAAVAAASQTTLMQNIEKTAAAVAQSNGQTQTAFAIGAAQTRTALSISVAQTGTAGATSAMQTQTVVAIAFAQTADAMRLTQTALAQPTNTHTPSVTPSLTPSHTPSLTPSHTPTPSITPSITPSATASSTPSPTETPSSTPTPSITPSITPSPITGQLIDFATLNGAPVTSVTTIRGDEYAGQDVVICSYSPYYSLSENDDSSMIIRALAENLPDCGPPEPGERRSLTQGQPGIYPPDALVPRPPVHTLRWLNNTDPYSGSVVLINFQRVIAETTVTVWFPGEAGVAYRMRAYDEQQREIGLFQTDQLYVPALYQLRLHGVERPIKQVVIETLPPSGTPVDPNRAIHLVSIVIRYP